MPSIKASVPEYTSSVDSQLVTLHFIYLPAFIWNTVNDENKTIDNLVSRVIIFSYPLLLVHSQSYID
jgi:hypothetical protein